MLQEIANIFAVFHDGGIDSWEGNWSELNLKIDCRYLAELVNRNHNFFYIKLIDIEVLELHPWQGQLRTDLWEILIPELEFAYSKIEENVVKVSCHQYNINGKTQGGELWIKANSIAIFTENRLKLEPESLNQLSKQYWEKGT